MINHGNVFFMFYTAFALISALFVNTLKSSF